MLSSAKKVAEDIANWNLKEGWEWSATNDPLLIRGETKGITTKAVVMITKEELEKE